MRWNLKEAGGKTLPRGTRISLGIPNRIRLQNKSKSKDYTDVGYVNVAGTWSESGLPYHGRSHGRVETAYETRSKASHEKSAEAIVPTNNSIREGLNFK